MTSFRQFEANRRNALKSTGPKSLEGKRMSRRNALRHGLTAETVIDGLEDIEDSRGFEAAIISDYNAETAVERELVLRLASLLWRLRRIIAIETDLFKIQAEILRQRKELAPVYDELPDQTPDHLTRDETEPRSFSDSSICARELTYCFLRLGNLDGGAFERLDGSRRLRRYSCLARFDADRIFSGDRFKRERGTARAVRVRYAGNRCFRLFFATDHGAHSVFLQ
jgi:hypothetical protein